MIIQTGDALGLLKFAGLPQGTAKKIFDNLKLTGMLILIQEKLA